MKRKNEITCPECNSKIALEKILTQEIELDLKTEFDEKKSELIASLKKKEEKLKTHQEKLEKAISIQDEYLVDRLKTETEKIQKELRLKARKEISFELQALQEEALENSKKLRNSERNELELLKQKRELENKKARFELDFENRIQEEKTKLESELVKRESDKYELQLLDKEKQLQDLRKVVHEAELKAEQGSISNQLRGETQELSIEDKLRDAFPEDSIEEIGKGVSGADCIHRIKNKFGQENGVVLFESKRTQSWKSNYVDKIKENMQEVNADIGVIITQAMPKEFKHYGYGIKDGIWICSYYEFIPLAYTLRENIKRYYELKNSMENKGEKIELLYDLVTGNQFRQHFEAIIEAFAGMQDQLNTEKRAFYKQWKMREMLIEKTVKNTSALYGSLQGIAGNKKLLDIKALELPEANSVDSNKVKVK